MSFISVLRKYNVEPVIFLYILARNVYMPTPLTQLLTDKICVNSYHLDPKKFCYLINEPQFKNTTDAHNVQKDVVQYVMYQQFILSIPSIIAAIFIGPWLDMHSIAPKIAIICCTLTGLFESCSLLLNVIYFEEAHVGLILLSHIGNGLMGNMILMTAVFTIAMKETPLEERTFRFTIIELAMVLPNPCGSYISSFILPSTPWLIDNQVRNYVPILLMAICIYIICLVTTTFTIGEVREICSPEDNLIKRLSVRTSIQPLAGEYLCIRNNSIIDPSLNYVNGAFERDLNDKDQRNFSISTEKHNSYDNNNNNNFLRSQKDRSMSFHRSLPVVKTKNASKKEIFTSLFKLRNATAMFKSLIKKREEKAHRLLWVVTAIYVAALICANGIPLIMVPFSAVVYGMRPNFFMKIESIGHLGFGLTTTFVLVILHRIQLNDTMSLMIGLVSLFFLNLLRGAVLYPIGLYISYVVGSLYLCSIVACRGFVSKIVPESEVGCVLGMLSCFFATSPVFASLLYTQIFKLSVETFPGLAFLVGAALMLLSIVMCIYLHIKYLKYKSKMESKKVTNG